MSRIGSYLNKTGVLSVGMAYTYVCVNDNN